MKKLEIYYYVITGYATYDTGHEYLEAYDATNIETGWGASESFKNSAYDMFEIAKDQFKYEIDKFIRNDNFRRRYRTVNDVNNELSLVIYTLKIDMDLFKRCLESEGKEHEELKSEISELITGLLFENEKDERIELIKEETETFEYTKEETEDEEEDEE